MALHRMEMEDQRLSPRRGLWPMQQFPGVPLRYTPGFMLPPASRAARMWSSGDSCAEPEWPVAERRLTGAIARS